MNKKIRNIAVIAHVDHGKTTLVDAFFKQQHKQNTAATERLMDSNDLEKERGITIEGKYASVLWKTDDTEWKINIADTPGHRDFGSEVDRCLLNVDCVILVVDVLEGIMPQTQYVIKRTIEYKIPIIILVNKIDRIKASDDASNEAQAQVEQERINASETVRGNILEFLSSFDESYLESRFLFGSGRAGTCSTEPENALSKGNIHELFDTIIDVCPAPTVHAGRAKMLVSKLDDNKYFGDLLIGYVKHGTIKLNATMKSITSDGEDAGSFRINKLFTMNGNSYEETQEVSGGDIAIVAGSSNNSVNFTIGEGEEPLEPLPTPKIEKPALSVSFFAINENYKLADPSTKSSINEIVKYLFNEARRNPGIKVEKILNGVKVAVRGELQAGVIVENMRRSNFQLMLGKPTVMTHEENGKKLEAYSKIDVYIPSASESGSYSEKILSEFNRRGATMLNIDTQDTITVMSFSLAAKNAIGVSSKITELTGGNGTFHEAFDKWGEPVTDINARSTGVLIATQSGTVTAYALTKRFNKGEFFIKAGDYVYKGQIIGKAADNRNEKLNVCEAKQLTNMRASGSDEKSITPRTKEFSVENGLGSIEANEYIAIHPKNVFPICAGSV